MALATSDPDGLSGGPQKPTFGPAVWGWGVVCGVMLWSVGFVLLPWWAALLLWWWPSILFGAVVGFAAVGVARLIAPATTGATPSDAKGPLSD